MDIKYLMIQGIAVLGTILFFLSYQCRSNKNLFRVQFLSYLLYTVHFLLLGALTGGLSYILNMVRSFCLSSERKFLRTWKMCALICALQAAVLAVTWDGWKSLLPIVANIAATIAGYTNNGRKIRAASMFVNSPLWIIYDILVGSWGGILDEAATELSAIISVIRFGWKNLDKTEEE